MKKPVGRPPKKGDRNIGVSVSIPPKKLKVVEKAYGSLTKYVHAKLLQDNI